MIANALDADGKFTASHVSRKLKQLGLLAPPQKKLETSIQLRDEDLSDFSMDTSNESDDETLLSLINRWMLMILIVLVTIFVIRLVFLL